MTKLVDQEVVSRGDLGIDYGSEGKVLVRTKLHLLVWRKPGTVWSGIGMPHSYVPAYLHVIRNERGSAAPTSYGSISITGRDLMRGGRLTRDRLAKVLPAVKKAMELPKLSMAQIDLGKTLVVE